MVKLKMPKHTFFFSILFSFILIFSFGSIIVAGNTTTSIGTIIDVSSYIGKEQKTAMQIAVQNFNKMSMDHKLSLHFSNFSNPEKDPLKAVYADGMFGAMMKVNLVNDGPVTMQLESPQPARNANEAVEEP